MLRIEKESDGCATRLQLSGRIQSDQIESIRAELDDGCKVKFLDLSEVTLVDVDVIRFLIRCEDEGVDLVQCPPYVRQWIVCERAEGEPDGIIRHGYE